MKAVQFLKMSSFTFITIATTHDTAMNISNYRRDGIADVSSTNVLLQ